MTAIVVRETDLPPDLRARYSEPQRHYHTWQHIEELLALFDEIEPRLADRQAVLFAILYHDAIYDPTARDNEERSVLLLHQQAAGLLDPDSLARAEAMVLATIRHELPQGHGIRSDMAHFLDMDLAILGAAPERFAEYERQIRLEYAHVPYDAFAAGRAAVLRRFAERPALYFSEWGRDRFEDMARANLAVYL